MLTSEEQRALLALAALVLAGALLGWLDARQPRFLALTLGDSLALGATMIPDAPAPDSAAAPAPDLSTTAESTAHGLRPGAASTPPGPGASSTAAALSGAEKSAYALDGKLNLNAADADALIELPGIGPKTAQRILADRRAHGPYRRISDLRRVKGIGPKTLARLLPLVTVAAVRDSTR